MRPQSAFAELRAESAHREVKVTLSWGDGLSIFASIVGLKPGGDSGRVPAVCTESEDQKADRLCLLKHNFFYLSL